MERENTESTPRLPNMAAVAERVSYWVAKGEDCTPEMAETMALAEMCEGELQRLENVVADATDRRKLAALYAALCALA